MLPITVFVVLLISSAYGQDRKISSVVNPNCDNCTTNDTLLYVRADGSHDTVHQLWDFTRGIPTVIFVISGLNATVNMTWNAGSPQKIWMSESPKYSFAVAIDKIYEYNDLQDNGYIDDQSDRREYPLDGSKWIRDELVQNQGEVRLLMKTYYRGHARLGTVQVKLDFLPFKDYAADLPHLIHTANSTLVDVSLVNLTESRRFNSSRFALRMLMVSSDDAGLSMNYTMRKSLDDEHTPGVFEIIEIRTPEAARARDGGFVQFRPVGYLQRERGVSSSTIAHVSPFNRSSISPGSTLWTWYGRWDRSSVLAQSMDVSFGEPADGFYKQHNYTAWSFTIGYGAPPVEGFSTFVLVIIGFGLGVPVLLALSGAAYVLARRARRPARLLDDQ